MNIGLDLDDTLVEWIVSPQDYAALLLGIHEYPSFPTDYNWTNYSEGHRERIYGLLEFPDFMGKDNCKYDPLDRLALIHWKEQGHKLIVLTARHKKIHDATRKMVKEFFPEIDVLVICDNIEEKRGPMVEYTLDLWIDDNPRGIEIASELGIRTYGIVNNKTRNYNMDKMMDITWKYETIELVHYIRDIKL